MHIDPLIEARSGERALTAHPRPRPLVAPSWRQRIRYFNGRHLTRAAFDLEHRYHDQKLGLVGLRLGAGVVDGLGTRAVQREGVWSLSVAAGHGLLADGRGVRIDRQIGLRLDDLPQCDVTSDQVIAIPPRGLGLVVLQPVEVGHRGDDVASSSHCIPLEEDLGWSDLQRVDGARLAFLPLDEWPDLNDSPAASDPRARNRLAYALFHYEAKHGHLPGSDFCLPIAALAITASGAVTVCDRHAAWRSLNVAPRRIYDRRSPALGHAQILQFADELTERSDAGENMPGDLQHSMRYLPPVALLPAESVNWITRRSDALPPPWVANAVPVTDDQLEAIMDRVRDLAPLAVDEPEQVQLLVPVPAASYEPELLAIEQADPQFEQEITELTGEVRQARSNRDYLDAMAMTCLGTLSSTRLEQHPPAANGDEHALELSGGSMPPPNSQLADYAGTISDEFQAFVDGIETSFGWSQPLVNSLRISSFSGLEPWVDELGNRIQASNDAVDQFFLALRSDIHRLRQVLGGTDTASRIGTSPILSEIAEGATGLVNSDRLQNYFKIARAATDKAAQPVDAGGGDSNGEDGESGNTNSPMLFRFDPQLLANAWSLYNPPRFAPETVAGLASEPADDSSPTPLFELAALSPRLNQEMVRANWLQPKLNLNALPWIGGSGGTLRTRQLVDRVRQPPAIEAKIKASATKARILRALADSDVVVGDLLVVLVTGPIALLNKVEYDALSSLDSNDAWADFQDRVSVTSAKDWASVRIDRLGSSESALLGQKIRVNGESSDITVSTLLSRSMRRTAALKDLSSLGLIDAILQGITDPDPLDGDESDYVSTAVNTLEGTVSVLRNVEGRLHAHKLVMERATSVIESLNKRVDAWLSELATSEATLAEIRHDLVVALGLFDEEQRRVKAVNQRRMKILTEQVEVVAVCRPRHTDALHELPSTALLPRFEDPLPEIFTRKQHIPDELLVMIDVVRHIPLGSLPDLAKQIAALDRRERLIALFNRARERARLRLATPPAHIPVARLVGSAAQSLSRIAASWQDRQQRLWKQRSALVPQRFAGLAWSSQQREALSELSLDDLIDGGRDAGTLTQTASTLIERIGAVVGAIYHEVSAVDPMLRLRWVERVSIHDDPASLLQPPAVLPGYLTLPSSVRRMLDHLIGYLGARFDATAEAQELASDLVRAAILVAARAPTAELARAHLNEEVRGSIGDHVDATIGSGVVTVGMIADFALGSSITASGTVIDLLGDRVRLRVTTAKDGNRFTLPAGTQLALRAGLR